MTRKELDTVLNAASQKMLTVDYIAFNETVSKLLEEDIKCDYKKSCELLEEENKRLNQECTELSVALVKATKQIENLKNCIMSINYFAGALYGKDKTESID